MNAPVDVLAVMNRLVENERRYVRITGDRDMRDNLIEAEKALAAMVEIFNSMQALIKAQSYQVTNRRIAVIHRAKDAMIRAKGAA